jgi:hypothetical protein
LAALVKYLGFVTRFTAKTVRRSYLNVQEERPHGCPEPEGDPTMKSNTRRMLLAAAFAMTVGAGLTGLSMSAQTKESSLDDACAHATWPMIPSQCLAGADSDRLVRTVTTRTAIARPETQAERFAFAFN